MTNLGQAILHVLNSYLSFSLEIDSSFEPCIVFVATTDLLPTTLPRVTKRCNGRRQSGRGLFRLCAFADSANQRELVTNIGPHPHAPRAFLTKAYTKCTEEVQSGGAMSGDLLPVHFATLACKDKPGASRRDRIPTRIQLER